jgi:hypothetical protein
MDLTQRIAADGYTRATHHDQVMTRQAPLPKTFDLWRQLRHPRRIHQFIKGKIKRHDLFPLRQLICIMGVIPFEICAFITHD